MREYAASLTYSVGTGLSQACPEDAVLNLPAATTLTFDLASGGCWYGHGFAPRQPYPLNREALAAERFAVNNTQSPIWLCSAGYAILAETTETLAVSFNAAGRGTLEIACPSASVPIRIFRGDTLPEAWLKLAAHLNWPPPLPDKTVFGDAIFCTWTQYPRCITQERILDMARAIRQQDYPCSILTIDDRWESGFGELTFSRDFADPRAMIAELHRLGFKVLLWVTPFINEGTANFSQLAARGWLVMRQDGNGPSLLKWWGGTAGLVDLTNPPAREWYRQQLLRLKNEVGVDGFKIDGGDAKYQPDPAVSAWHAYSGASGYSDLLLALFEEVAPNLCETRTVWLSQGRQILWREGGKDTHWGVDNGLQAMVSLGLHMALMGYDRLIPDMVPGRIQTMVASLPLPTDELLVRWTEASAVFPILQLSYFPWNYAPATAAMVRQYAVLHKALEDYLYAQAANREAPLLRPLWFDYPRREEFYTVADQFLLGSDLLAAPVLAENQVARDVLLPPGSWRDAWTGKTFENVPRLLQHPAPCPGMPLFVRATNDTLFRQLHAVLRELPRGTVRSGVTTSSYACGLNRDIKVTG